MQGSVKVRAAPRHMEGSVRALAISTLAAAASSLSRAWAS